jgi:hypothetical protein
LEELMAELTMNVNRLSLEMREFKEETRRETRTLRQFIAEMSRKAEVTVEAGKQETDALRQTIAEMSHKIELAVEEGRQGTRNLRQSIAEVSRKMGTLAEDLVAPSVPRILREVVGCEEEPLMIGVRIRRSLPGGRYKEYDVVSVCGEYLFINETKTRLQPEDVPSFVETLEECRDFLPEYADKKVIGALATFYIDPSLVVHGERQGLIMLGVVDGLMRVLNREGFAPRAY